MDLFSIGWFKYTLLWGFSYHNSRKKFRKDIFSPILSFFHTCIATFALFIPILIDFSRPPCYVFALGEYKILPLILSILPYFSRFVKEKIIITCIT